MVVNRIESLFRVHYAWVVVVATFVAMLVAAGVRSTFGVYLKPLEEEFLASRADVALVASLSIIVSGISQPIIGQFLDRYGVRAVATTALAVGTAGIVASSAVSGLWQMYITFGVVVSAAASGAGTTMATVVATRWFAKKRGLVIGIMSGAHSAGQVILIPVAMQLSLAYGWRMSYVLLGIGMAALLLPLGLLIRNDPRDVGRQPLGAGELSASDKAAQVREEARRTPLGRALRMRPFWQLAISFFVCGFAGSGTIATHLVAYTVGRGLDPVVAAAALGIAGGMSVIGTISAGIIIDHVGRKNPLAAVYFIRGIALFFLFYVDDPLKLNIFAVIYGLGSFATVPPTAALTAHFFGRASVGLIFGLIFLIHQIGGALGSFTTGLLFDLTGSYQIPFAIAVATCVVATLAAFSIKEESVSKPAPATV